MNMVNLIIFSYIETRTYAHFMLQKNVHYPPSILNTFPLKSKKYKILNHVLKKYLKKANPNIFGVIKNQFF